MKKKTKEVLSVPKVDSYKVTLSVMGRKYESVAQSVREAIAGLSVKNCKGKAILSVEKDGVKVEKIIMPFTLSRVFNSFGITREIALKQISTLFLGL